MKYTITIIASTVVFAVLGLLAAWGTVAYGTPMNSDGVFFTFLLLPLGGAGAGLGVGCLAATIGKSLSQQEREQT